MKANLNYNLSEMKKRKMNPAQPPLNNSRVSGAGGFMNFPSLFLTLLIFPKRSF